MPGSVYTFIGTADPSNQVSVIQTSQGSVNLGGHGLFLPDEVAGAQQSGIVLIAGPSTSPASQLVAPSASAGSAGVLTGVFRYVVTFTTGAGETTASSEAVVALASKQGSLTGIPIGSAFSGVTGRKIYRTIANGASGTEKFVVAISDNTTTVFTDNTADVTLGISVPTVDTSVVSDTDLASLDDLVGLSVGGRNAAISLIQREMIGAAVAGPPGPQGPPGPPAVIPATVPRVSSYLAPSGGDDGGPINAAISTICDIWLGAGTFALTSVSPLLPRNATYIRIRGAGRGLTTIQLSATVPQFLTCNRIADYDLFANIEVKDLTVDANNVTDGSTQVVAGSRPHGGTTQQRLNFDNWLFENIDVINVPYDPTGTNQRSGFGFWLRHLGTAEATQTYATNITFKRCRINPRTQANPYGAANAGPNRGFLVVGNLGGTVAPSNTYIDNILIEDCEHNTGHVPTAGEASTDSNIQIGSLGFGGSCTIRHFRGAGSNDVGIELDGMTRTLMDDVHITDAKNCDYLWFNFNNPKTPTASKHVARDCFGSIVNAVATGTQRSLYWISGESAGLLYAPLNEVEIRGGGKYSAQTDQPSPGWLLNWQGSCNTVTIEDVHGRMDQINATLSADASCSALKIFPSGVGVFRPRNIKVEYAGTIALAGHVFNVRGLDIEPAASADLTFIPNGSAFDFNSSLTGVAVGFTYAVLIGGGSPSPVPTIRGELPGIRGQVTGSDTDPYGVYINLSTVIAIDRRLYLPHGNFGQYPTGGTTPNTAAISPYYGKTLAVFDTTQATKIKAPGWRRPGVDPPTWQTGQVAARGTAGTNNWENLWPVPVLLVFTNAATALLTDVQYVRFPSNTAEDAGNWQVGVLRVASGDVLTLTYGGASTPAIQFVVCEDPQ